MEDFVVRDRGGEFDLHSQDATIGRPTVRSTSCRPTLVRRCFIGASAAWA